MTGEEILKRLSEPFADNEIDWLPQKFMQDNYGNTRVLVVPYVQARACMNRLDAVLTLGWQDRYTDIVINGKQAFNCELSIKVDGEWITRSDGAEPSNYEPVKGAYSGAFKRACVKFGIGRYLYDLEPVWLPLLDKGQVYVSGKLNGQKVYGNINPPSLSNNTQPNRQSMSTQPQQPPVQQQPLQQQQPPQQQQQSANKAPQNDRKAHAIDSIYKILQKGGIPLNFIPHLLEKTKAACTKLEDASIEKLTTIYHAVRSVVQYLDVCYQKALSVEQVIYYAQVVTGKGFNHINDLYFEFTYDHVNHAVELINADAQKQA